MSNLTDFISSGGGKLRFQEFFASGAFTPSAKLIANGGVVMLDLRGGGGGAYTQYPYTHAGGNSKHIACYTCPSTAAIGVTIGAAGTSGGAPTAGGNSGFGTLGISGGMPGTSQQPGAGGGNEGTVGQAGFNAANNEWTAARPEYPSRASVAPNCGSGGGMDGVASAGYCRVMWFE